MKERPLVCARPTARARCPYCHDELQGRGVSCGWCEARHHSACLWEAPACACCGADLHEELDRTLLREADERAGWLARRTSERIQWTRRRYLYYPAAVALWSVLGTLLVIACARAAFAS